MRILGIDPGLATIGLGLAEATGNQKVEALEWLTLETAKGNTFADRLGEIATDLEEYLRSAQPELVVIEKLYFSVNEKTALDVAQARGVIVSTVAKAGIPIIEPTPPQLKSCIAGDGKADKKQMQKMVMMMYKLTEKPEPDDAVDALALAAYGAFQNTKTFIA